MTRRPDPSLTLLPWAALFLQIGALYVLAVRTTAWVTGRPPDWGAGALPFMAIVAVPLIRWDERERFGGQERWAEYRTTVRTGVLSPGAEPTEWLPRLRGRLDKVRGARWAAYVMSVVLVGLWATLMIKGRAGWEGWFVGAALLLALAVFEVRGRWLARRLELLLAQLPSGDERAG